MPEHLFNKQGGLNFPLRCNYDVKNLNHIRTFCKDILIAFHEIKKLCNYAGGETGLSNNKQILVTEAWETFF